MTRLENGCQSSISSPFLPLRWLGIARDSRESLSTISGIAKAWTLAAVVRGRPLLVGIPDDTPGEWMPEFHIFSLPTLALAWYSQGLDTGGRHREDVLYLLESRMTRLENGCQSSISSPFPPLHWLGIANAWTLHGGRERTSFACWEPG